LRILERKGIKEKKTLNIPLSKLIHTQSAFAAAAFPRLGSPLHCPGNWVWQCQLSPRSGEGCRYHRPTESFAPSSTMPMVGPLHLPRQGGGGGVSASSSATVHLGLFPLHF